MCEWAALKCVFVACPEGAGNGTPLEGFIFIFSKLAEAVF